MFRFNQLLIPLAAFFFSILENTGFPSPVGFHQLQNCARITNSKTYLIKDRSR